MMFYMFDMGKRVKKMTSKKTWHKQVNMQNKIWFNKNL